MAFGYLAFALALALCLNATNRFLRAAGTLGAAIALCMIVVSTVMANIDGTFRAAPAASSPLGAFTPAILNVMAGLATAAAAFLFWASRTQLRRLAPEAAPSSFNAASSYGLVSRYMHWTTATLVLFLAPIGLFVSVLPDGSADRAEFLGAHESLGIAVFALAIVRLIWRLVSPAPSLPPGLAAWERRLATAVHAGLYGLILAIPVAGFLMCAYRGQPARFLEWTLPSPVAADKEMAALWASAHDVVLPALLCALIAAHLGGVLKHHAVDGREGDIHRMLT